MKNEMFRGIIFYNTNQVKAAVNKAVDFYNKQRPHMSIDMMTPVEASQCVGEIAKRWKSYRLIAIKSRLQGIDIAENSLPLPNCQGSPYGLRPPVNP